MRDREADNLIAISLFGYHLRLPLGRAGLALFAPLLMGVLMLCGLGVAALFQHDRLSDELQHSRQVALEAQQQVAQLEQRLGEEQQKASVFAASIGQLQARLMRLDSLGSKLVKVAALKSSEFDFSLQPAVGGFHTPYPDLMSPSDMLQRNMRYLDAAADTVEMKLSALDYVLKRRSASDVIRPHGWPTRGGWLSSPFGQRLDPFTGLLARHEGVDIANHLGEPVYALAPGIVTFADRMTGYGYVVDIKHSHGYTTRYAHMSRLSVAVGDVVRDHQQVGAIGSTGHSTGPHLHLEVRSNGRLVNPKRFLSRS